MSASRRSLARRPSERRVLRRRPARRLRMAPALLTLTTLLVAGGNWVSTVGVGYVWKIFGTLYLNPWAAGHVRIAGDTRIPVGAALYEADRFLPEASLKIGWHFQ